MEVSSGIYAITNWKSGRAYIGSTVNLKRRWGEHEDALQQNGHGNPHLQSSWNKYGEEAFEFMVCEYVDPKQLIDREQYWLDFYRMYNDVYNILLVVGRTSGMLGKRHSKETRQQMRVSASNRPPISDETRLRMRKAHLGKPSPTKGRKASEKTKRTLSEAHTGKVFTEEHKYNISRGLLNMDPKVAAERSRKLSEAGKGRKHTKESRCKMSKAAMGNQNSLGHQNTLGYRHTKEAKCKISEGIKRSWEKRRAMGVA